VAILRAAAHAVDVRSRANVGSETYVTQPKLLQFKTNYFEVERAERQAEVLRKTIVYFEGCPVSVTAAHG
jgi:hypothetical protein